MLRLYEGMGLRIFPGNGFDVLSQWCLDQYGLPYMHKDAPILFRDYYPGNYLLNFDNKFVEKWTAITSHVEDLYVIHVLLTDKKDAMMVKLKFSELEFAVMGERKWIWKQGAITLVDN